MYKQLWRNAIAPRLCQSTSAASVNSMFSARDFAGPASGYVAGAGGKLFDYVLGATGPVGYHDGRAAQLERRPLSPKPQAKSPR